MKQIVSIKAIKNKLLNKMFTLHVDYKTNNKD